MYGGTDTYVTVDDYNIELIMVFHIRVGVQLSGKNYERNFWNTEIYKLAHYEQLAMDLIPIPIESVREGTAQGICTTWSCCLAD